LSVLFGSALGLLFAIGLWRSSAARARESAFIAFTAAFPVICQVIGHGPAFSGLRHFLFAVPPLAVLAGIGFDSVLTWLEARRRASFGRTTTIRPISSSRRRIWVATARSTAR